MEFLRGKSGWQYSDFELRFQILQRSLLKHFTWTEQFKRETIKISWFKSVMGQNTTHYRVDQ